MDLREEINDAVVLVDPVGFKCGDYDVMINSIVDVTEEYVRQEAEIIVSLTEASVLAKSSANEISQVELAIRVSDAMRDAAKASGDPLQQAVFVTNALWSALGFRRLR
jgi:hypothetical protein